MRIINRGIQRVAIVTSAFTLVLLLTGSQALAQNGIEYAFAQDVPEQTITFLTINPYTKVSGSLKITFSGVFHVSRMSELRSGTSRVTGDQSGTFTFTPDDPTESAIVGKFRFSLGGETFAHTDTIDFYFKMDGASEDGSPVTFVQAERALLNEGGYEISFGKTKRLVLAEKAGLAENQ